MAGISPIDGGEVVRHVVLRDRVGGPGFVDSEDRLAFLAWLRDACAQHGCGLHGYVLMDRRVELLLTSRCARTLLCVLGAVAQGYDAWFAGRYGRTGAVWGPPHVARRMTTHGQVLAALRELELAPVRAWRVDTACAYRWSSHGAHAWGDRDAPIAPHAAYLALGPTPEACRTAYRALFAGSGQPRAARCGDASNVRVRPAGVALTGRGGAPDRILQRLVARTLDGARPRSDGPVVPDGRRAA